MIIKGNTLIINAELSDTPISKVKEKPLLSQCQASSHIYKYKI